MTLLPWKENDPDMKYSEWVPFELSHVVCTCEPLKNMERAPKSSDIHKCGRCDKYYRWLVQICTNCKTKYVQRFSHPNRCVREPRCWECVQDISKPCEPHKCYPLSCSEGHCVHKKCSEILEIIPPDPVLLSKREKVTTFVAPALPKAWRPTLN